MKYTPQSGPVCPKKEGPGVRGPKNLKRRLPYLKREGRFASQSTTSGLATNQEE